MNKVTAPREISVRDARTKPLTACLTSERMFVASPAEFRSRKKTYGFARYSRSRRTDSEWLRRQEKRRSRYSTNAVNALLRTSSTRTAAPAKTRNESVL